MIWRTYTNSYNRSREVVAAPPTLKSPRLSRAKAASMALKSPTRDITKTHLMKKMEERTSLRLQARLRTTTTPIVSINRTLRLNNNLTIRAPIVTNLVTSSNNKCPLPREEAV